MKKDGSIYYKGEPLKRYREEHGQPVNRPKKPNVFQGVGPDSNLTWEQMAQIVKQQQGFINRMMKQEKQT